MCALEQLLGTFWTIFCAKDGIKDPRQHAVDVGSCESNDVKYVCRMALFYLLTKKIKSDKGLHRSFQFIYEISNVKRLLVQLSKVLVRRFDYADIIC